LYCIFYMVPEKFPSSQLRVLYELLTMFHILHDLTFSYALVLLKGFELQVPTQCCDAFKSPSSLFLTSKKISLELESQSDRELILKERRRAKRSVRNYSSFWVDEKMWNTVHYSRSFEKILKLLPGSHIYISMNAFFKDFSFNSVNYISLTLSLAWS